LVTAKGPSSNSLLSVMSNQKINITGPDENHEVTIGVEGHCTDQSAKMVFQQLKAFEVISKIILDFSKCTNIDSSGLGALLEFKSLFTKLSSKPQIIGCNQQVLTTLRTVGLHRLFDIQA